MVEKKRMMMKMMSKLFQKIGRVKVVFFMPLVMMLTGCGQTTKETFENIRNQGALSDMADDVVRGNAAALEYGWKETVAYYAYVISDTAKTLCFPIILVSFSVGILGLILIKKDQKVRRTSILMFLITIPILAILFTYGVTFFASHMLGSI